MKHFQNLRFPVVLLTFALVIQPAWVTGQEKKTTEPKPEFQMTVLKQIPATSIKSQASTSTCWCFSTTSMIESEIMRLGNGEVGLSEMFTVNHVYLDKAKQYVKFHGTCNFDEGGEQHDVLNSIREYGLVPRDIYPGLNYGETTHKHGELVKSLTGIVGTVIQSPNGKISPVWTKGVEGVLDAYLGEKPVSFSYKGKMVTPVEYSKELGINPDDYIEFTSYTHHPFYKKFVLEIPDNWAQESMYNVPIDELMEIVEYSLNKGISIAWGADISDLAFDTGFARIMADGANMQLTDDHGMHLTGLAQDQFGNKYIMEKNSWGERGKFKGYSYLSVPFMRMRTMSIMLHKDGIPPQIAQKIGLK